MNTFYRHFKGNAYLVLGAARLTEDATEAQELVTYRALYGAGELWVRPAQGENGFFASVNGQPRFKEITWQELSQEEQSRAKLFVSGLEKLVKPQLTLGEIEYEDFVFTGANPPSKQVCSKRDGGRVYRIEFDGNRTPLLDVDLSEPVQIIGEDAG